MNPVSQAGGLFSIDKDYFYEIGSYDEGMDIWGKAQFALTNISISELLTLRIFVSFL